MSKEPVVCEDSLNEKLPSRRRQVIPHCRRCRLIVKRAKERHL